MADTVNTQIVLNGFRNAIFVCSNHSDGTGESLVKKIDASATGSLGNLIAGQTYYPGTHMKISRLEYDVRGASAGVDLFWEATSNVLFMSLSGAGTISLDEPYQIINSGAAGATGSVLLSTVGFATGNGYTITFHVTKNVPQS